MAASGEDPVGGASLLVTTASIQSASESPWEPLLLRHDALDRFGTVNSSVMVASAPTACNFPTHIRCCQRHIAIIPDADGDKQPEDFHYTHLWVDKAGETHLKECSMTGFDLKTYAKGEGFLHVTTQREPAPRSCRIYSSFSSSVTTNTTPNRRGATGNQQCSGQHHAQGGVASHVSCHLTVGMLTLSAAPPERPPAESRREGGRAGCRPSAATAPSPRSP
jgi:hypothetical protein